MSVGRLGNTVKEGSNASGSSKKLGRGVVSMTANEVLLAISARLRGSQYDFCQFWSAIVSNRFPSTDAPRNVHQCGL